MFYILAVNVFALSAMFIATDIAHAFDFQADDTSRQEDACLSTPVQIVGAITPGDFERFRVKASTGNSQLIIQEYSAPPVSWWEYATNQWVSDKQATITEGIWEWSVEDFSSPVTFQADRYYMFAFYQGNICGFKGTNTTIEGMQFYRQGGTSDWVRDNSIDNIWFEINDGGRYWSTISTVPEGVLNIRESAGLNALIIKTLPIGWVVRVLQTADISRMPIDVDGHRWYQIQDVSDGSTGWAVAGPVQDGHLMAEYLPYDFTKQADLEQETIRQVSVEDRHICPIADGQYIDGLNLRVFLATIPAGVYDTIYVKADYVAYIYPYVTKIYTKDGWQSVAMQISTDRGNTWSNVSMPSGYLSDVDVRFLLPRAYIFDGSDIYFQNDWGDNSRGIFIRTSEVCSSLSERVTAITSMQQFAADGTTLIGEHATTTDSTVVFKAVVDASGAEPATVQVELRRTEEPFTGISDGGILQSDLVAPGTQVALTRTNLIDGAYHWRARTLNDQGNSSDWQEFGIPGGTDFIVDLPLSYKAANLAKQLVNQNYLWGGKGWDANDRLFVDTDTVKTGYNYWTDAGKIAFDDGLDCSGLVAWSYNHSYAPSKFFNQNYIGEPNANKQYWHNMQATTTSDVGLQPGDLLYFDPRTYHVDTKTWTLGSDGIMDHVAMYIGGDTSKNVIHARSKTFGIQYASINALLGDSANGFVAFGRPKNATIAMSITKHSPIHFSVIDPDGNTISDSTGIATDEEYIQESGDLTYATMGMDANGYPEDVIYSPILKQGIYKISVSPMASSTSNQTYSLDFTAGSTTIVLAQNMPLSQIPSEGYGITVSAVGAISTFIPVSVDIKPGSYPNSINLGSNGVIPVAIFGSATFDVHQIDPTTIKLADASIKIKGNGQPMVSYSDVNGDGITDAIVQITTQALQLTIGDTMTNLEGSLISGDIFKGSDSINIVP